MSERLTIGPQDLLLVVDPQNDFCPGGALAVTRGDEIIPIVNRLAESFAHVVLTQDWHPPGHLSFASSQPGKKPFEAIAVSYGTQILWPDHCVQGSVGAAFRADLAIPKAELILRKGFDPAIDSYSAFRENDRKTRTGLAAYLQERGFRRLFIAGLALDFCVRYSAEDAQAEGFEVVVLEDACRAIATSGSLADTWESFGERLIPCVSTASLGARSGVR